MLTKIIHSSLVQDTKENTWFFMAKGRDGSTYAYNTFSPLDKNDKHTMFTRLSGLIKDGLINKDYWRLV